MKIYKNQFHYTEPPIKSVFDNFTDAQNFIEDNDKDDKWGIVVENIKDRNNNKKENIGLGYNLI